MPELSDELLGRIFGGCRLEALIGHGGSGRVYRATQVFLERPVAVKILHEGVAEDPRFVSRLTREARLLASLRHPNIAHVHAMSSNVGAYALVMELIDGQSLERRLLKQGALDPLAAAQIGLQIARALNAAWLNGIVHGDLKPGNVMLTQAGIAKVVDFGLAHRPDEHSHSGARWGSVHYMSPEQVRGRTLDIRSDLYALGATLWHCLTGQRLFPEPNAVLAARAHLKRPVPPPPSDIPRSLRELVVRLLKKDPNRRPQTPIEVIEWLESWLEAQPRAPWVLVAHKDHKVAFEVEQIAASFYPEVVVTASGADALAAIEVRGRPEVAIASLVLNDADGFTLLERLKDEGRTRTIAVCPFDALHEAVGRRLGLLGVEAAVHTLEPTWLRSFFADPGPLEPTTGSTQPDEEGAPSLLPALVPRVEQLLNHYLDDLGPYATVVGPDAGASGLIARAGDEPHRVDEHVDVGAQVLRVAETIVVDDAADHPVLGAEGEGSFAGLPLRAPGGRLLGSLTLSSPDPGAFPPDHLPEVAAVARRLAGELYLGLPFGEREMEPAFIFAGEGPDRLAELEEAHIAEMRLPVFAFDDQGRALVASKGAREWLELGEDPLAGISRDLIVALIASRLAGHLKPRRALEVRPGPYCDHRVVEMGLERLLWTCWPQQRGDSTVHIEVFDLLGRAKDTTPLPVASFSDLSP